MFTVLPSRRAAVPRRAALSGGIAAMLAGPAGAARPAVRMAVPAMAEVIDPASVPLPVYRSGRWCEGPV